MEKVLDGIFNQNNTTGGKLFLNLGDISEDVIKDGSHAFDKWTSCRWRSCRNFSQ